MTLAAYLAGLLLLTLAVVLLKAGYFASYAVLFVGGIWVGVAALRWADA